MKFIGFHNAEIYEKRKIVVTKKIRCVLQTAQKNLCNGYALFVRLFGERTFVSYDFDACA